jgi:hypothetical protein
MRVRIGLEQREKAIRVGADKIPQIGRGLGDRRQDLAQPAARPDRGNERLDRLAGRAARNLGQPRGDALARLPAIRELRRRLDGCRERRGRFDLLRSALRPPAHPLSQCWRAPGPRGSA